MALPRFPHSPDQPCHLRVPAQTLLNRQRHQLPDLLHVLIIRMRILKMFLLL